METTITAALKFRLQRLNEAERLDSSANSLNLMKNPERKFRLNSLNFELTQSV